jgi:outer membrane biosynthesis protein TonB
MAKKMVLSGKIAKMLKATPKAEAAPAAPAAAPKPEAKPKAPAAAPKPEAKPKAPAAAPKPEAKPKAEAAPKPKATEFAIHINKTGRVCFGKDAAERLGDSPFCTLKIDGKIVRLEPVKKEVEGAIPVRDASGRPYISATKQFKPLGFDGSRPYDIEAKPYGNAGFEFRLA